MSDRAKKNAATKKELKKIPMNMRFTESDRELLRKLTAAMDESSDTQTVIKLIRKEARERGLLT